MIDQIDVLAFETPVRVFCLYDYILYLLVFYIFIEYIYLSLG